MSDLQRWKPTNGDVNKIKMEVSDDGEYVKLYDYLILKCIADANALEIERLQLSINEILNEVLEGFRYE